MPRDFLTDDSQEYKMEKLPGRDFLTEMPKESLGTSLALAIPRVGEDIIKGGYHAIQKIPDYFEKSKTEIPGFFQVMREHPLHAAGQAGAGLAELGHNLLNIPRGLAEYSANRLNLIPQATAEKVPYQKDISQDINSLLGTPEYPGESLIRGSTRNSLNLLGGGRVASALNPMNLTAKSIAKDVINTEKKQVKVHNKMYNNIWDEAKETGFNSVPYDANVITPYRDLINKSYPQKSVRKLDEFISNPTLENAQKAQSDLGNLRRSIEEKSRTTPLLGSEKDIYDALAGAEKHIEENMFKNTLGEVNEALKNKYQHVTNSYRENVVPYKYNPAIQAYKNKETLAGELVNSLSRGEFAAKKGHAHHEIKIRNMLKPALTGLGLAGGAGWLWNQILGNPTTPE